MSTGRESLKRTAATLLAAAALIGPAACSRSGEVSAQTRPSASSNETAQPSPQTTKTVHMSGKILVAMGSHTNHDVGEKDLATGVVTNITNTPSADELNPQVMPNGEDVVYAGNASGTYQIYRYNLKNHTTQRLTRDGASDFDPTPTPDGHVLYKSNKDDGYGDIWKMTIEGADKRNLTPGRSNTEEWGPTAVTDTSFIYTSSHADDGTMNREQLSKTGELVLTDQAGDHQLTHNTWPDWYPKIDPHDPKTVWYTGKVVTNPTGPDSIFKWSYATPNAQPELVVGEPYDCSDEAPANDGILLFAGHATDQYDAMARTPDGKIVTIMEHQGADSEILSPVPEGPIQIG